MMNTLIALALFWKICIGLGLALIVAAIVLVVLFLLFVWSESKKPGSF